MHFWESTMSNILLKKQNKIGVCEGVITLKQSYYLHNIAIPWQKNRSFGGFLKSDAGFCLINFWFYWFKDCPSCPILHQNSFKNNIRHNEIAGCIFQITSNSYSPTVSNQYIFKSIAIVPFIQMTISKIHKFRSEIYIYPSSFLYYPATKLQSSVRNRKKIRQFWWLLIRFE